MAPHAEERPVAARIDFHIGDGLGVSPVADRVLAEIHDPQRLTDLAIERVDEGIDRPVAQAANALFVALEEDPELDALFPIPRGGSFGIGARFARAIREQFDRVPALEVFGDEALPDGPRCDFTATRLAHLLDLATELDLQIVRQPQPALALEQKCDAALAGLAVHPNHSFVAATHVRGVDRQIGNLPAFVAGFGERRHPFLDCVLMRTRKRRVDELARIGMARVHGQPIAELCNPYDSIDVVQHEPGIDALAKEIQREGDDVDVAGALPVAE